MTLQEHLLRRREAIAASWYRRILETYPAQSVPFLSREQNPFQNPIGGTIRPAVTLLVERLAGGAEPEAVREPLDDIVRVRSVQGFSAAGAVGFVLELKQVVREELGGDSEIDFHAEPLASELAAFEQRLDRVALLAFDIYMECREQLYALRAEEGRRRTAVLMRRFGMEAEEPAPEPAAPPS